MWSNLRLRWCLMSWERDEWLKARDDTPVRRFAGGIEIVGDPEDALDEGVADRNTDTKRDEAQQ
jgi:hypothetical protein